MFKRISIAVLFLFLTSTVVCAGEPEIYSGPSGRAIKGYDPVAYFTQGKALEGSGDYTFEYKGASWSFSSAANKAAFEKSPEKYAPQYGGYCAYAVSQGHTAPTDPEAWTVVDGKLYLNYSLDVRALWRQDTPRYIKQADANWPGVLK